jgi:acetyl esterase/lipase
MQTLSVSSYRVGGLAWLAIVLWVVGCAAHAPPRAGEKIDRDVLFAAPGGHELRMDLYVPQTARPAPVVLWIFGGGWRIGSKGYHVNVRDLTRSGIAVAAIQYRMSDTAVYPAQLDDCRAAVQWLRVNGSRHGLDPQRIGASGESAGGHLAALLGMVEGKASIRAVCALYPPTDLITLGTTHGKPRQKNSVEKLLGGPIQQRLTLAAEASPINHVSASSPPFLLIHGANDGIVPLEQSQALLYELEQAKVEARLIVVPGKRHWFRLDKQQAAEVARFFQTHFEMLP